MTRTFLEGGIRLFPGFLSHILLSKIHFFKCMFLWRLLTSNSASSEDKFQQETAFPSQTSHPELRGRVPYPNPPPTLNEKTPRSDPIWALPLLHTRSHQWCRILDYHRLFLPMEDAQIRAGASSALLRLWVLWMLSWLLEMAVHQADPQGLFLVHHKPHLKVVFSTLKCLTRRPPTAPEPCWAWMAMQGVSKLPF